MANDKGAGVDYIEAMRMLIVVFVPLFALLVASVWFAVSAWMHLGGDIPFYGYLAIAGGVLVSLAVGGGLMALVFYSNRHGYDDGQGHFGDHDPR